MDNKNIINRYCEIYSELGLVELIKEAEDKIKQFEKDCDDVINGKKYNPLYKDEWVTIFTKDIHRYKDYIKDLKAALEVKRSNK